MMKKLVLIPSLLFLSVSLFAQQLEEGIQFNHLSWKNVLAKAKQEDKLVFVDVVTSWCGPCKMMAAKVFPLKEVGKVFNSAFVNYKIDAEQGEGKEIAEKFNAKAFPTYLFVNGDGELIYRSGGYREPDDFLKEAAIAIKEKDNPKPFAKWEDEFNTGKRDKEFLKAYLQKRKLLKMPSAEIIELVLPLLTKQELKDKSIVSSIIYFDPGIEYVPMGRLYKYVTANAETIDSVITKSANYSLSVLQVGLRNYLFSNIIQNKREKKLSVAIAANKELSKLLNLNNWEATSKEIIMNYYSGTHNVSKLIPTAKDYVYNGLLKQDIKGMMALDKADFVKTMEPYLNGKEDSTKKRGWVLIQRIKSRNRMVDMSYSLRRAAEAIYKNVDDKKVLGEAVEWAKLAESWFPHYSTEAVYAALLFKLGKQREAINMMTKASEDNFIQGSVMQETILANVEKMKRGTAPGTLW